MSKYCILVPCYNSSRTIVQTIQSIVLALKQNPFHVDVYFYDDNSSDNTGELILSEIKEKSNFYYIKNLVNMGQWRTKNKAFESFENIYNWCFILHADDFCFENWLSCLIPVIEKVDKNCFSVWSSYDSLSEPSGKILNGDNSGNQSDNINLLKNITHINQLISNIGTPWHISGAAINVDNLIKLGYFDYRFEHYSDAEIIIRAVLNGMYYKYVGLSLMTYRVHDSSQSSVTFSTNRDIKESFLYLNKYENLLEKRTKFKILTKCLFTNIKRIIKKIFNLRMNNLNNDFYYTNLLIKKIVNVI